MNKDLIALIFLASLVFVVFVILPLVYIIAKKVLKSQKNESTPAYMLAEISDGSGDEYEPPYKFVELKPEETSSTTITNSDEYVYDAINFFTNRKQELNKGGNGPTFSLKVSVAKCRIRIGYSYSLEERELTLRITDILNIIKKENGGPDKLRFKVQVSDKNSGKSEYNQKLKSSFLPVEDSIPVSFRFYRISLELLDELTAKIVIIGSRRDMLRSKSAKLGAVYTKIKDLSEFDYTTKAVLPLGKDV